MTAAQPKLFGSTAEQDFKRLIRSRYDAMVKRFSEKRDKNNRITRHGRIVPFSLQQFQAWVLEALGGKADGAVRCYYQCGDWITLHTMVLDHRHPVSLGGSLALTNLVACCDSCNALKGGLSEQDFGSLRNALGQQLSPFGMQEVTSRLRKSVKLAAGVRWAQKQKRKQALAAPSTAAQQEMDQDEF